MAVDREKYLDAGEVRQLRTYAEHRALKDLAAGRVGGPLAWAVVDVALLTGLRVGEMAALAVGDVDLRRGALRVHTLKRRKPLVETLAIAPELVEHLRQFIDWKQQAGQPAGKGDALFTGKRGPLTVQGLQQIWKKAVRHAGIPGSPSIHSARHTIGVHALAKTGNLRLVQKLLRHASPVVTANLYADVPFDKMKEGVTGLYDDPK